MADAKTEKQKVQEITEKLEQGLKELFDVKIPQLQLQQHHADCDAEA